MTPDDLTRYATLSDPQIHPDGTRVAFVVSRMNFDDDRYDRQVWLWDGEEARPFTHGPVDSRPRWSPDGVTLAFLRASGEQGEPAQIALMPAAGGEARIVTDFGLGASEAEWSPGGDHLAAIGSSWADPDLDDDERKRRPRRITGPGYRFDDRGWLHDRRSQVFVLEVATGETTPLTSGDPRDGGVRWRPDGAAIGFLSARHETAQVDSGSQAWEVPVEGGEASALTEVGYWVGLHYRPDGAAHVVGHPDRWSYPRSLGVWRLEDGGPVELGAALDRNFAVPAPPVSPAGPQWLEGGPFRSVIEDRGMLRVVEVSPDGTVADIVGGRRMVTGMATRPSGTAMAMVISTPTDPGELVWWEDGEEQVLTSINQEFRGGLVEPQHFVVDHDGVELDAWVLLPPGDEAVPLLLNIHGGPATQYGFGFFDEFQVYVDAGFGVVACNPRGSSGRGTDFVRVPVGRWPEDRPPDLEDILAVTDAALEIFPRLDADHMGIMGGSYGGFMTTRILAVDDRWRSAVPERGVYSWNSFAGTSDIGHRFPRMYLEEWAYADWDRLWAASPLSRAHRITTPCLIIHSEEDWRCPIEQAEQLFSVLLDRGVEVEMLRFPGSSHELSRGGKPRYRRERFEAIVDWHRAHLGMTD